MSNVTLETLTRAEAHRKLLALGMPVGQVTHVLDHPSELLNAMRPAFTVAATEDAVAIVAAYQRHCTTRTDPIDAVSAEGRERIAQRAFCHASLWTPESWNTCPKCKGPVEKTGGDVDFADGDEAKCTDCGTVLMVSIAEDGGPCSVYEPEANVVAQDERSEVCRRMQAALFHIWTAQQMALESVPGGEVRLAIVAKDATGAGSLAGDFDAKPFLADVITLFRAFRATGLTVDSGQDIDPSAPSFADASLDARAKIAMLAHDASPPAVFGGPWENAAPECHAAWIAVVRAVDASRPGLTEEEVRPRSRPYIAEQRQRERSQVYADFEKMGQLESDVIEWLSANYEPLKRRALEASRASRGKSAVAECGHELWSECGNCGHKSNGRLESCPKCGSNVDALAIMVGDDYEFDHRCQPTSSPAPGDVAIPRAVLESLVDATERAHGVRKAREAAERVLHLDTLRHEPAQTDPEAARRLAEARAERASGDASLEADDPSPIERLAREFDRAAFKQGCGAINHDRGDCYRDAAKRMRAVAAEYLGLTEEQAGNVQSVRRRLGLTQERLGVEIGYRSETISRWENGHEAVPRVVRLALIGLIASHGEHDSKRGAK